MHLSAPKFITPLAFVDGRFSSNDEMMMRYLNAKLEESPVTSDAEALALVRAEYGPDVMIVPEPTPVTSVDMPDVIEEVETTRNKRRS